MRFVALALIALTLPLFIAWLNANRPRRNWALVLLGLALFLVGTLRIESPLIVWSTWPGTSRGIVLSPIDMLAIALIVTRNRGSDRLPFRVLIGLYAVPVVVSAAFAAIPLATTFTIAQLMRMALIFVAVGGELARPGALSSLLHGLSLGLIVQAGFVVQQKLGGVVQAAGTLPHQNLLGLMVELSILPLIAGVLEGERSKLTYVGIAAGLIVVAGGGSRATMGLVAAAIVVLTLLSIMRRITPRKLRVIGLGVLAMALIAPLGFATLKERFGESSLVTEESQRIRYEVAARAISADYPFGIGANMFATFNNTAGYAARAGIDWYGGNLAVPVHNAYLLARAETGWAGQGMLLALLIIPIFTGLRLAFGDRKDFAGGVALGSTVGMMTVALHSNYEYGVHTQAVQALFFIDMAVIAGTVRAQGLAKAARRREVREEARRQEADSPPVPEFPGTARPAG